MSEEEIKHEFKPDLVQCRTCLSVGRKLSPLGSNMAVFKAIVPQCVYLSDCSLEMLEVCWECHCMLLKIAEFRNRVLRATEILQIGQAYLYGTLSSLVTVIYNDTSPNTIYVTQTNKPIHTETKLKTIDFNSKELEADITDEFIDNVDMESVKDEFKKESTENEKKSKKAKNSKWAKKRALFNKKPKFQLILDYEEIFRKVKMDSNELLICLEKEKDGDMYRSCKYKCESCVLGFKDKNSLAAHVESHHTQSTGPYTCDICNTHICKRRTFVQHIREHYYKYVCKLCAYSCYHKTHRHTHRREHGKVFQCVKCELMFGSRREFFKHFKEWHEKFICDHCGVSFKMRYCIKDHIRKQHSPFECKPCNKRFSRYNGLWLHNKVRHSAPGQVAYCVECDRRYSDVYRYRWHLSNSARHRPTRKLRIPCPGCEKVFTKKIYMKDHYDLVHLKKYKYRCEQCDKNFLRNADLVQHRKRVHEGILPPKNKICYMCGRGFSTNKILNNHVRTHTGERPFACARCPAAFAQSAALAGHTRAKHDT